MKTFTITKSDIDEKGWYTGDINTSEEIDGHLTIEAELGYVRFKTSLGVKGSIFAKHGSGIKAGLGIEAGEGIKAGLGIEAGEGIEAGSGIKAGLGIEAGEGIEAGWGIEAGLEIIAKTISSRLRIFAGLATWKQPEPEEMQVRAKLIDGEIAFGELVEPEIAPIDLLRSAVEAEDMDMAKEALAAFESAKSEAIAA